MRYEVFTAGEELFHVGDELLIVATVFDQVYMYVVTTFHMTFLSVIHHALGNYCSPKCMNVYLWRPALAET